MLKLISARTRSHSLQTGEIMQYLPLPELTYKELKADFKAAPHLAVIDELDLSGAGGVLVKCKYREDGILAAAYLFKKFELQSGHQLNVAEQEEDDDAETDADYPSGEEPYDGEPKGNVPHEVYSILYKEENLTSLPVITSRELSNAYNQSPPMAGGFGFHPYQPSWGEESKTKKPYWFEGKYPLVVTEGPMSFVKPTEAFKHVGRFIIYIMEESSFFPEEDLPTDTETIDNFEKTLRFELDFEGCRIASPSSVYLQGVIAECAREQGYSLSKTVDRVKLIELLKSYRGHSFASYQDMEILVRKAIKKKKSRSKTLTKADFDKVFIIGETHKKASAALKPSGAAALLDQMIGLDDVKAQLVRVIKRMKFDKQRSASGLKTSATHMAAVFMGSPGTAKTTTARIFGQMLCEEEVLNNNQFVEVSRKDLVGKYVGWTAPTVAGLFGKAKGGTIFIDEAYSLMSEGQKDGFSDEALSEIIRQMENNPDTLVIFAGYTDKMKHFIQEANPGLRSRLTNIIAFEDYTHEQMWGIFNYFVTKEEYVLADAPLVKERVEEFIEKMKELGPGNTGNGRLMRKLFKSAVSYMAEREAQDLRTLTLSDVEQAAAELFRAEAAVLREQHATGSRIGFVV
ncbi:ATP-binding protein [Paenibacillus validus]|uniref:AAA family ATPase n=1 Tax=Paenibacillus validus TaxID=44253 RepID=A0A7X2Z6K8_9BACL|nr:AAA family ATPase [Paenibacillus validus]MUG69299.1 AAA family ATPase [Paenibacillus validus]